MGYPAYSSYWGYPTYNSYRSYPTYYYPGLSLTAGGHAKAWQLAAPSSRRLREMEVAMEQMRMHAEMNKPAEPQPVNPRDVA